MSRVNVTTTGVMANWHQPVAETVWMRPATSSERLVLYELDVSVAMPTARFEPDGMPENMPEALTSHDTVVSFSGTETLM